MEKYEVNQKIWKIEINKNYVTPSSYSSRQDGVNVEELKILGVSKYKIVLNNDWFTTLDNDDREGYRKDNSLYSYIDKTNVSIRTGNSMFGDGVFITLYSTEEPNEKLLKKMVAKTAIKIKKEYGFLFNGVIDELYNITENYAK